MFLVDGSCKVIINYLSFVCISQDVLFFFVKIHWFTSLIGSMKKPGKTTLRKDYLLGRLMVKLSYH